MKRNTYYAIAASVLIFCTIINYGMSNLESTGGTRSHSGGFFGSGGGGRAFCGRQSVIIPASACSYTDSLGMAKIVMPYQPACRLALFT